MSAKPPTTPEATWPHNATAERSLLGSILMASRSPEVVKALAMLRQSGMAVEGETWERLFYFPAHVDIFRALLSIMGRDAEPNAVDLACELTAMGRLESVGGPEYLATLMEYVMAPENAPHYAGYVIEACRQRRVMAAGMDLFENLSTCPTIELIGRVMERLERAKRSADLEETAVGSESAIEGMMRALDERERHQTLIPYPWRQLNDCLGGIRERSLVCFAGKYGAGKTTMGNNLAFKVAEWLWRLRRDGVVVYITTEEPRENILFGIASIIGQIDSFAWQKTPIPSELAGRFESIYKTRIMPLPLHVVERRGLTVEEMIGVIESIAIQAGQVRIVILDYIQNLALPDLGKQAREEQRITAAVHRLRDWAHDGRCPGRPAFIALVQEDTERGASVKQQQQKQKTLMGTPRYAQSIYGASDHYIIIDRADMLDADRYKGQPVVDVKLRCVKHRQAAGGNANVLLHKPHGIFYEAADY